MIIAKLFFLTFIIPFFISFFIQFFLLHFNNKNDRKLFTSGNILGIILSCISGYLIILGLPLFPPLDLNQTIFYLFLITGLISIIITYFSKSYQQNITKIIGLLIISSLAIKPLYQGLGFDKAILFIFIICTTGFLNNFVLVKAFKKDNSLLIQFFLLILTIITSVIIFMSGSALISELTAMLAVSVSAGLLISLLIKYVIKDESLYFYTSLNTLFCFVGYYLLEIPVFVLLMLLISPLTFSINFIDRIQTLKRWKIITINVLLFSIPLTIAFVKTMINYLSKDSYY